MGSRSAVAPVAAKSLTGQPMAPNSLTAGAGGRLHAHAAR